MILFKTVFKTLATIATNIYEKKLQDNLLKTPMRAAFDRYEPGIIL